MAVAAVDGDHVALRRVAVLVAREHVGECIPSADVGPAHVGLDHHGAPCFLHDGPIDGFRRTKAERVTRSLEVEVPVLGIDCGGAGFVWIFGR